MNTSAATNTTLNSFIAAFETQIITPIVTLLALGAFLFFIWGVVEYIRNAENAEKRSVGQQHILWGVIGLTIIFGAAAIVKIISSFATLF